MFISADDDLKLAERQRRYSEFVALNQVRDPYQVQRGSADDATLRRVTARETKLLALPESVDVLLRLSTVRQSVSFKLRPVTRRYRDYVTL